jgi:hypothetical protein
VLATSENHVFDEPTNTIEIYQTFVNVFENTRRTTVALAIEAMNSDGDFVTKYVNGKVEMHPLAKMKVILKKSTRDSKRYRQEMLV